MSLACPIQRNVTFAELTVSLGSDNESIVFSCADGFRLVDSPTQPCLNLSTHIFEIFFRTARCVPGKQLLTHAHTNRTVHINVLTNCFHS